MNGIEKSGVNRMYFLSMECEVNEDNTKMLFQWNFLLTSGIQREYDECIQVELPSKELNMKQRKGILKNFQSGLPSYKWNLKGIRKKCQSGSVFLLKK